MIPMNHALQTLLLTALLWLPAQAHGVEFQRTMDEARKDSNDTRPMVVCFGAPWCGWCRKMDVDTFQSPEVKAIANQYLWVKVDVDEQQEVAARYQVEGLPRTLLLDAKGRVLGSSDGYLAPSRFIKFLEESLKNPLSNQDQVAEFLKQLSTADNDKTVREAIVGLVEVLAKPSRVSRTEILQGLKQQKSQAQKHLLALMKEDRLAIRAAASNSLKHCLNTEFHFDPFVDKKTRENQLLAIEKLLEK